AGLAGFLKPQQFGELGYLCIQAGERGIFSGNFLLQIELHDHEYGEQKYDTKDQGRQGIDKSRPVVHAAFAAAGSCQRYVSTQRLACSRTRTSSSFLISRCCAACESTQSRIICCSVRIWCTRPWMASARFAIAAEADLPASTWSTAPRRRSIAER